MSLLNTFNDEIDIKSIKYVNLYFIIYYYVWHADPSCIEQPHRHSFTIRIFSFVIEKIQDITHNFRRFAKLTVQSFSHSLSSVFVYTLYITSRINSI
jgi:hypothetical protein